ncbi:hypothetical protein ACOSQ3_009387 [Xanthoceras sorbifolium]
MLQGYEVSICLRGSEIPKWFIYQSSGSSVYVQVPKHKLRNRETSAFALCAVIGFENFYVDDCGLKVSYAFHAETSVDSRINFHDSLTVSHIKYPSNGHSMLIDSDHIVLWNRPFLLENDRLLAGDSDYASISFEFNPEDFVGNPVKSCKVKCCEVSPMDVHSRGAHHAGAFRNTVADKIIFAARPRALWQPRGKFCYF